MDFIESMTILGRAARNMELNDQKLLEKKIAEKEWKNECEIEYQRDLGRDQMFNPEAI